jgi:hypothetical protein
LFAEHDVVALRGDRPEDGLKTGDVGAIVHCYPQGSVFEVEFIDERGQHKRIATVPGEQLMKLNLLSLSA